MAWVLAGRCSINTTNGIHHVQAGDAYLGLPESSHHITIMEAPLEYYWAIIYGRDLVSLIATLRLFTGCIFGLPTPTYQLQLLIDEIHCETFTPNMERHQYAAAHRFLEIAADHHRQYGRNPTLARAISGIERHLHNPDLSVQSLARLISVHRGTLPRLFRDAYAKTPSAYILERRMERACAQLRNTDLKVIEVAGNCGFENLSSFSRAFRRHTGVSPSEYRCDVRLEEARHTPSAFES